MKFIKGKEFLFIQNQQLLKAIIQNSLILPLFEQYIINFLFFIKITLFKSILTYFKS